MRKLIASVTAASLLSGCAQEPPERPELPDIAHVLETIVTPGTTMPEIESDLPSYRAETFEELVDTVVEEIINEKEVAISFNSVYFQWLPTGIVAEEGYVIAIFNPLLAQATVGDDIRLYTGGVYFESVSCNNSVVSLFDTNSNNPLIKWDRSQESLEAKVLTPGKIETDAVFFTQEHNAVGIVHQLPRIMTKADFISLEFDEIAQAAINGSESLTPQC